MKINLSGIFTSLLVAGLIFVGKSSASAQAPYQSSTDFAKYAMKLRESALLKMEPKIVIPTTSHLFGTSGRYPWKTGIVTTIFWVGEPAGGNNPVHNFSSSWDLHWEQSYGGYDNPNASSRGRNFAPVNFIPRQNPFYIALPYNDVTRGATKPEAPGVIPWFKETYTEPGKSVCRDRWIAIRGSTGKVCYAQWSDCGPFRTDHYQYVFQNERPKPNLNKGAGLDVSPAVRDFLGLANTDTTDWKFVDFREVPKGPWSVYGDNNDFVMQARRTQERVVSNAPLPTRDKGPTVIVK